MENNEDKAIQEEIIDNLVKKNTELEKRINKIGEIIIPDYKELFNDVLKRLDVIRASLENEECRAMLGVIMTKLDSEPKKAVRQIRILFFPETNQGQYYKIVFGRLIPWSFGFLAVIGLFITCYKVIELYRYKAIELPGYRDTQLHRYNQDVSQSMHYQRAWFYLQQHSKKKTLSAMDEAFVKTADK